MKKLGSILISIGGLFLAAALLLFVYNFLAEKQAKSAAQDFYESLENVILQDHHNSEDMNSTLENLDEIEIPDYILNPEMEMPEYELDGYRYIGTIEISSLDMQLPVMSEWSYAGLKNAPGRYAGSVYTNDIVIAAHNYTSHFGQIKKLAQGDTVQFTDIRGNVFIYHVIGTELLGPYDTEKMVSGVWDLTLFTCTIGGAQRVTVRCELADEIPCITVTSD